VDEATGDDDGAGGAAADAAGQQPVSPDLLSAASCWAGRQNPEEELAPTVWVRWAA